MPAPNLAVSSNSPADISDKLNFIAGRIQRLSATGAIPDNDADTTGNAATADLADRALVADSATTATTASSATTATTATRLATPRAINGVAFDGTAAITVTADAATLTGTTLAGTITSAFLNRIAPLVIYANNAAALAAGEIIGNLYRNGGDPDTVCVVH